MAKIYTSQFRYQGNDRLDVTVKGNHPIGSVFAPTWYMVNKIKDGTMSEKQYKQDYYNILRNRYLDYKDIWDKISKWDRVTFVCYCNPNNFCHRYLLAYYFSYLYKDSEYLCEIKIS